MSSPRQKMVVVQPGDVGQRKKRQTLERAKANHLSKQLQMRLQYAKLKVEHGWQRQNLNEVENLYFHHSHLRSIRQGVVQRPPYASTAHPPPHPLVPVPAEMHAVPSPVPDRSTSANDAGSLSPPTHAHSPPEHAHAQSPDLPLPSQLHAPVPLATRPPSALDLSDPTMLARLAQLQAQPLSQSQTQTLSHHPLSASASQPAPTPAPLPLPASGIFTAHVQPSFTLLGTSTLTPAPGSIPLYPIPSPGTPHTTNPPTGLPVPTSTSTSAPIPTTSIPTPTPIAPGALTYDSFWSTHASTTGPTRALYRTHTGFTASATPGGNVAMLTPGGHAAVMTAEGVYVGGASK